MEASKPEPMVANVIFISRDASVRFSCTWTMAGPCG